LGRPGTCGVVACGVVNCVGVIVTTNYMDAMYLPPDDRRHYVAWSEKKKDDFDSDYWNKIWSWYAADDYRHVAAHLARLDISGFDAKAPPPKTAAFWSSVDANRPSEKTELMDIIDALENTDALTLDQSRTTRIRLPACATGSRIRATAALSRTGSNGVATL